MSFLTERPLFLFLSLFAALLVCFVFWIRSQNRRWAIACFWVAGTIPLLSAVSFLIVMPSEQIEAICRQLAVAVDEGDVPQIGRFLAVEFNTAEMNRGEFLERLEATLTNVRIDDVTLSRLEITFPQPEFGIAEFGAGCTVRSTEFGMAWVTSRWRLTFSRYDRDWLVTRVESIPVPPLHVRDVRQWLR